MYICNELQAAIEHRLGSDPSSSMSTALLSSYNEGRWLRDPDSLSLPATSLLSNGLSSWPLRSPWDSSLSGSLLSGSSEMPEDCSAAAAVAPDSVPSLSKLPMKPLVTSHAVSSNYDAQQRIDSIQQPYCISGSPLRAAPATAAPGLAVLTRCSHEADEGSSPLIVHSARVRQWVSEAASIPVPIPSPQNIFIRDSCCSAVTMQEDYKKLDDAPEMHKRQKLDTSVEQPKSSVIFALTCAAWEARRMQPFMPGSKPGYDSPSSPMMRVVQQHSIQRSPLVSLYQENVSARSQLGTQSRCTSALLHVTANSCDSELVTHLASCEVANNLYDKLSAAASDLQTHAQMRENVAPVKSSSSRMHPTSNISVWGSYNKGVPIVAKLAQRDEESLVLVWLSVDPRSEKVVLKMLCVPV